MANMLDNAAIRSIAKHRGKLMSLVESTKRKKAANKKLSSKISKASKYAPIPPSNIEHLVFKKIPTSPPVETVNGIDVTDDDEDYDDGDEESDDYEVENRADSKHPEKTDFSKVWLNNGLLNEKHKEIFLDSPDLIMGLGSNHVLSTSASDFIEVTMVEEFNGKDLSSNPSDTQDCDAIFSLSTVNGKPRHDQVFKSPPVLRLRNKNNALSKSERKAKGRSTSDDGKVGVRKTVSEVSDSASNRNKRPTSQFYVADNEMFKDCPKSVDVPNLLRLSSVTSGSQPVLSAIEQLSSTPDGSGGLLSRYMTLRTSTPHLTTVDGFLQKFRKSFAFRFQKRKSESTCNDKSNTGSKTDLKVESKQNDAKVHSSSQVERSPSKIVLPQSVVLDKTSTTPKNFHNLVLRTIRERKASRRRADCRNSLMYDYPNVAFIDKLPSALDKGCLSHYPSGSDANLLRKRAASTSDYSPKSKSVQRPLSVIDNLSIENSSAFKIADEKQELLKESPARSQFDDLGNKNFISLEHIWRSNPVKLCRVHSRLLMCRHKGRYRLRRSISQPVELESLGSVSNLDDSCQGYGEHEHFHKGSSSDDDAASSDSDIYHSFCCSPTRRSNTCWELSSEGSVCAEALWDHETSDTEELPFQAGDLIEVTDTSDREWWWGTKGGRGGWFPAAFVRLYVSHRGPSTNYTDQPSDDVQIPYSSPGKASINNLSCEQVRANIVQEIIATERDYVKHLKDVVEGYLKQVHRRPDMFSKDRINTVFGNIKDIYQFQSQFLKQLEERLQDGGLHLSQIGDCFLENKEKFKMYSEYCNNHPLAVSELQELYCESQYVHFFEACRLLQEMIDISLDGFLLTPIQRICKYPLQLAELLKFTNASHADYIPVTMALAAMKDVAELVNERKRRMECLERLAEWQSTIEGWEGSDVLDTSSMLIHCGEVTRISSSWSRDVYIFIFDHLLVYCKKDLLKRQTYAYKGRLNLDSCDIVDIDDGKDSQFAVNVKNAWKLYCKEKDKWFLFYAKTAPEKEQWLAAFRIERKRVSDDMEQGFVVTDDAKRAARLAIQNKHKPKRPRAKFNKGRRCHPDVAVTELLLDPPSAKSRTGSLPSNIHPEFAIMAGAKMGPPRKKGSGWFHFGSGKKPKS